MYVSVSSDVFESHVEEIASTYKSQGYITEKVTVWFIAGLIGWWSGPTNSTYTVYDSPSTTSMDSSSKSYFIA